MTINRDILLDANGTVLRRPVVYLDHSTLVDAFDGKRGDGANVHTNADLAAVVENVADRGTLCLSVAHVIELSNRPRREDALAMARWLDSLKPMWFQIDGAAEWELEAEVRRRLRMSGAPSARLPIHPAMTAALHQSLGAVSVTGSGDVLSAPNVFGAIRDAHGKLAENAAHAKVWMVGMVKKLHDDRSNIPKHIPKESIDDVLRGKVRQHLEREARRAIEGSPVEFGEDYPTPAEISCAVAEVLGDPVAIPLTKISYDIVKRIGASVTESNPESGKFRDRYGSFFWDTRHALAGAVVDVFTCDRFVDGAIADFRTQRGMDRQLSLRGGRDRPTFVSELRDLCDRW